MGVYGRLVDPRHTMKNNIIVICKFVTFSRLKLGWNTEVKQSKQHARISKLLFVNFLFLGEERKGTKQKVDQLGETGSKDYHQNIIMYNKK